MVNISAITEFVRESNRIEGITREPTLDEVGKTSTFAQLPDVKVGDLEWIVGVYAPGHVLRVQPGLNVRVGDHIAPPGGPQIRADLEELLKNAAHPDADPWLIHVAYETLHPFTDGNGRSGRALWLNMMIRRGEYHSFTLFLHRFYYQTLSRSRP